MQQPRELGLFLLRKCSQQLPLGLEMARSDTSDERSLSACEADEQAAAIVRIGDALDQPLPFEPVDQVRHSAPGAHERSVKLGRGATVRGADTAQRSQDIPARAVQAKTGEVLVQAPVEQGAGAADAGNTATGEVSTRGSSRRHSARTTSTWSQQAYRRAAGTLEASEHCERYEVSRCSEDPTQHAVRIEWDSEEGHLSGFRKSLELRSFFEAVGPFVHDIEEMRHYQVTLSSAGS